MYKDRTKVQSKWYLRRDLRPKAHPSLICWCDDGIRNLKCPFHGADEYHVTGLKKCELCPAVFVSRYSSRYCKSCGAKVRVANSIASQKRHLAERKLYRQQYYQKNWERINAKNTAYHLKYPEKAQQTRRKNKLRRKGVKGSFTLEEWNKILQLLGYQCLMCGSSEITVDHMVPLTRGGTNYSDNLQPLCGRCNSKKATRIMFPVSDIDTRLTHLTEWTEAIV